MKKPVEPIYLMWWLGKHGLTLDELRANPDMLIKFGHDYNKFYRRRHGEDYFFIEPEKKIEPEPDVIKTRREKPSQRHKRRKEMERACIYWQSRGLCEESAKIMAGLKPGKGTGCNGGPRNVRLAEEWARFQW